MDQVDRKRSIVLAAKQSFALYGYKATTMDHVAKLANVGKGTIYTFFSSKEELLDVILQDLISEMKALALEAIREDVPFFENLHNALYAILRYREEQEMLLRLGREVRDFGTPAAREALDRVEEAILAFIQYQVEHGVANGSVRACNAELVAFVLFKTYVALVMEWDTVSHRRSRLSNEDIATLMQQMFVTGLHP